MTTKETSRETIDDILDGLAIETSLRDGAGKRLSTMAPAEVTAMHGRVRRLREHSLHLRQRVDLLKRAAAAPSKAQAPALKPSFTHILDLFAEVFAAGAVAQSVMAGARELVEIGRGFDNLQPELAPSAVLLVRQAVRGLAKMELVARHWRPDYIVAPDAGGMIVGQYLAKRLGIRADRVIQVSSPEGSSANIVFGKRARPERNLRVLAVDDIATSWIPLQRIHAAFPDLHVQSACLVAAGDAAQSAFGYPTLLASSSTVDLPWATTGSLTVQAGAYLLGAVDGKQVTIPKADAERAIDGLVAR